MSDSIVIGRDSAAGKDLGLSVRMANRHGLIAGATGTGRREVVMDLATFKQSLNQDSPPEGLSSALQALWWDAKGDWDKAHHCVDDEDGKDAARVHAYLHRKEGDQGNASYWYSTAGASFYKDSLDAEWAELAAARLKS